MNSAGEFSTNDFGEENMPGPSTPYLGLVADSVPQRNLSPKRKPLFEFEEESARRMLKAMEGYTNIWQKVLTRKKIKSEAPEWELIRQAANLPSVKVTKYYFEKIKKAIIRKIDLAVSKGTISKDKLDTERYEGLKKMYATHPYSLWTDAEFLTKHIILHRVGTQTNEWSTTLPITLDDIKRDDLDLNFVVNGEVQQHQHEFQLDLSGRDDDSFFVPAPTSTSQPVPLATTVEVEGTRHNDGAQHTATSQAEEESEMRPEVDVSLIKISPPDSEESCFVYGGNTSEFSVDNMDVDFSSIKNEPPDNEAVGEDHVSAPIGEMENVPIPRSNRSEGNSTPIIEQDCTLNVVKEEPLDSDSQEEHQEIWNGFSNLTTSNVDPGNSHTRTLAQEEREGQLEVTQDFQKFIRDEVLKQPQEKVVEFMRFFQYMNSQVTRMVEQETDPETMTREIESIKFKLN